MGRSTGLWAAGAIAIVALALPSAGCAEPVIMIGHSKDMADFGYEVKLLAKKLNNDPLIIGVSDINLDVVNSESQKGVVRRKFRAFAVLIRSTQGKTIYRAYLGTGFPLGNGLETIDLTARDNRILAAQAIYIALANVASAVHKPDYQKRICDAVGNLRKITKMPSQLKGRKCFE